MDTPRILVTGSAGYIGGIVCRRLASLGHAVRGFDLRSCDAVDDNHIGDLADPKAVDAAVDGCGIVIHLGAEADDCDFPSRLLPSNILGVYNVFDAARRHGVRRMIAASSMQVDEGTLQTTSCLSETDEPAPRNHYGVSKLFAEDMGRLYSAIADMSVLMVRIGWCTRDRAGHELQARLAHGRDIFLSRDDTARFFELAVKADRPPFATVYATSRPATRTIGCLDRARELLGYEPEDMFREDRPDIPDFTSECH